MEKFKKCLKGLYQIAMLDKLVIKTAIYVTPFVTKTDNASEWSLNGARNFLAIKGS